MQLKTTVLVDNLTFPEGPRWHEDRLWFSDMYAHQVMTVDLNGEIRTIVEVPGQPSGLGWNQDGHLLVVSMTDCRLLKFNSTHLVQAADLSNLAAYHCNDMVVDVQGRAYIGNFGFNIYDEKSAPKFAEIMLVMSDGNTRVVADDLAFPNGTVITPDGQTLIVAETNAARLTAFDIEPDGSLSNRRVWAKFDDQEAWDYYNGRISPDGICLDAEGAIWVASGTANKVLRVREGGEITHSIHTDRHAFACMLGGSDRRMLFILTAETYFPAEARAKASGRIETIRVDVPGAGLP